MEFIVQSIRTAALAPRQVRVLPYGMHISWLVIPYHPVLRTAGLAAAVHRLHPYFGLLWIVAWAESPRQRPFIQVAWSRAGPSVGARVQQLCVQPI